MSIATIRVRATRRASRLDPRARRAREIRGQLFTVLGAVAKMIPSGGDVDGHAAGVLTVAGIAEYARLSGLKVRAALMHFKVWRVLWVRHRAGSVEVRFERRVIVGLLAAQRVCPLEVRHLMAAHRRRCEAAAPYAPAVGGLVL